MLEFAALAAVLGAAGVWATLRARRRRAARAIPTAENAASRRPTLGVSDVLLYGGEELWLWGCLRMRDERGELALFFASTDDRPRFVVAGLLEDGRAALLKPTDVLAAGSVPTELPLGGRTFRLIRRAEVMAEWEADPEAVGAPAAGGRAVFAALRAPGDRHLIVIDLPDGGRLRLLGDPMHEAMLDRLPGR